MDAVGFIGSAGEDFAEEDDFFVPFADGDVEVSDGGAGLGEVGELVVVRGEERAAAGDVVEVLGDSPGNGEAIEGGGAATDFIEDDEGIFAGVVEDERGFVHFHHEGGLAAREVIGGTDAAENAVGDADGGAFGGDESSNLCHQGDECDLANVGGFSGHVGASDDVDERVFGVERGVVWHKGFADEGLFEHRVAAIDDFEAAGDFEGGASVAEFLRGFGEGGEGIERGDGGGGALERIEVVGDVAAELQEEFEFELAGAFLGAEDFVFHFLEGGGDVALAVGHGLLAGVIVRDLGEVGTGDLDEVAEDVVKLDF